MVSYCLRLRVPVRSWLYCCGTNQRLPPCLNPGHHNRSYPPLPGCALTVELLATRYSLGSLWFERARAALVAFTPYLITLRVGSPRAGRPGGRYTFPRRYYLMPATLCGPATVLWLLRSPACRVATAFTYASPYTRWLAVHLYPAPLRDLPYLPLTLCLYCLPTPAACRFRTATCPC